MDAETLRPVITDELLFRTRHADDPAVEILVALRTGDPNRALGLLDELLAATPDSWRWRALRADAVRDLGDHDGAIAEYRSLVAEQAGTTAAP
jgi:hypothetical protein